MMIFIRTKGFTLIELILVIILLSIIAAVSTKIISQGLSSYLGMQNLTEANWQGQLAMERMSLDIRDVGSVNDINTYTSGEFSFTNTSGSTIDYKLSGTNLVLNGNMLATGVSALTFSYYDQNGNANPAVTDIRYVKIKMTINVDNANYSMQNSVYLRN